MTKSIINLEKLTVKRRDVYLVKNLSWQVCEGERWVVMGPNGCGKSTMVQLMMGHLFPMEGGAIYYFGKETPGGNLWDIRKSIGYVSSILQMNYKPSFLCEYVVLSGFFSSNGVYVEPTIEQWGKVEYWMDFFEVGYLFKRAFGEISYGEQRRLLIARAMVHNPKLIILDEPCMGLDIPTREKLLDLVNKLGHSGVSMIYVTHVLEEIVSSINKVMFMKDGKTYLLGNKEDMLVETRLRSLFAFPYKIKKVKDRFYLDL